MQLALIPPLCFIDHMGKQPYSLFLPQLMQGKTYCDAVWESTRKDGGYGILDNGAAEGVKTSIEFLLSMADFRGIEEIVIPDTIADAKASIHQLEVADKYLRNQASFKDHTYMSVIQGKTVQELVEYADAISDIDWISTIGIPRHINKTCGDPDARLKVMAAIFDKGLTQRFQIHFLGADYSYPKELKMICDSFKPLVRGMDTSMPYVYAYSAVRVDTELDEFPTARPEAYFSLSAEHFDQEVLEYNIAVMRSWIGE